MNVIIIEDEKPAARRLQRMLATMGMEVTILLHSVSESIDWFLENEHPDLIFLDIQLSDGISFEIFEEVTINSAIIFTTAYDEYALKAFKLNSIDYLLKPIDTDELQVAVDKFKNQKMSKVSLEVDLNQIRKLIENPLEKKYKKRFTVQLGQYIKVVVVEDVECFYSENKGTYLYTNNQRNYLIEGSLDDLENTLDSTCFFRVSRQFIVNINAIKDIVAYTNSRLQLKLNTYTTNEIIVSREKVKSFKNWLA